MLSMMRAHGLDPGPTQRPLTAGLLAGLAAALPALAILDSFAWLEPLAALLGTTPRGAALLCTAGFTLCGAAYALALGRGANDPLGGWLFGLACGFFLWMLVPLPRWLDWRAPSRLADQRRVRGRVPSHARRDRVLRTPGRCRESAAAAGRYAGPLAPRPAASAPHPTSTP